MIISISVSCLTIYFSSSRALDAGPILLILTTLVAIFTIGLGDNQNQQGLSAYSVFNRGFERIMGSVDADALLAQHVGGGFGGMAFMGGEDAGAPNQRGPVHHAREAAHPAQEEPARNVEENDNENNNNRARRSGKKARRRNLEQRRELRQQRQTAAELGFDGTGGVEEMMAMQRLLEEQIQIEQD